MKQEIRVVVAENEKCQSDHKYQAEGHSLKDYTLQNSMVLGVCVCLCDEIMCICVCELYEQLFHIRGHMQHNIYAK